MRTHIRANVRADAKFPRNNKTATRGIMQIGIRRFAETPAGCVRTAIQSGEDIELTYHGRDYAVITSANRMAHLELTDDIVQGLLQLARRDAECAEYQAYAEAIEKLVAAGHLDLDVHPDTDSNAAITT